MFQDLSSEERLTLLKFLCAFAWTDLDVQEAEKRFIRRVTEKLSLDAGDRQQVEAWLHVAPSPNSVTPDQVPTQHRRAFLEAVRALIYVDGEVDAEERDAFEKLQRALG